MKLALELPMGIHIGLGNAPTMMIKPLYQEESTGNLSFKLLQSTKYFILFLKLPASVHLFLLPGVGSKNLFMFKQSHSQSIFSVL